MTRPTAFQQKIAQALHVGLPSSHHASLSHISNAPTPGNLHEVKENMTHQTRPASSIAPWSSFDAYMPFIGFFFLAMDKNQ